MGGDIRIPRRLITAWAATNDRPSFTLSVIAASLESTLLSAVLRPATVTAMRRAFGPATDLS